MIHQRCQRIHTFSPSCIVAANVYKSYSTQALVGFGWLFLPSRPQSEVWFWTTRDSSDAVTGVCTGATGVLVKSLSPEIHLCWGRK